MSVITHDEFLKLNEYNWKEIYNIINKLIKLINTTIKENHTDLYYGHYVYLDFRDEVLLEKYSFDHNDLYKLSDYRLHTIGLEYRNNKFKIKWEYHNGSLVSVRIKYMR